MSMRSVSNNKIGFATGPARKGSEPVNIFNRNQADKRQAFSDQKQFLTRERNLDESNQEEQIRQFDIGFLQADPPAKDFEPLLNIQLLTEREVLVKEKP